MSSLARRISVRRSYSDRRERTRAASSTNRSARPVRRWAPRVPRLTDASFKPSATEELLLAGEKALLEQGDLAASRRWFESAARAALNTDDVSALARAALGLGGLWVHEHRTAVYAARVRTWQREALERLDPCSPWAARLAARVAAETDYEKGSATAVLAALDGARTGADAVLLADTLNLAHHCLLGPEHGEHRLALARELLAVAAVSGRVVDETLGLLWLTVDLLLAGDPHAGRALRELRAANKSHGLRAVEYVLSALDVMLAIRLPVGQQNAFALELAQAGVPL